MQNRTRIVKSVDWNHICWRHKICNTLWRRVVKSQRSLRAPNWWWNPSPECLPQGLIRNGRPSSLDWVHHIRRVAYLIDWLDFLSQITFSDLSNTLKVSLTKVFYFKTWQILKLSNEISYIILHMFLMFKSRSQKRGSVHIVPHLIGLREFKNWSV